MVFFLLFFKYFLSEKMKDDWIIESFRRENISVWKFILFSIFIFIYSKHWIYLQEKSQSYYFWYFTLCNQMINSPDFGLYHTNNIYLLNNWEDLLTRYANESLMIKCTKHITCILVPVPSGEINMSITISWNKAHFFIFFMLRSIFRCW